ncbi:EF-hand domain-containing protein [Nonomuraea sp. NPDC050556]|uniref:EF-hand domain-containing protein n=1 Tax=Nonomuraea sp. NPDC050556 TaxID=3364369 RepID=UPI0037961EC5
MMYGSAQAIADAFDMFDSDNDGLLSKEEVTLGLCLLAQRVSEDDVDFLIDLCDGDGDGQLSREEFSHLRQMAPAPYYGGEPMFTTFESHFIDPGAFCRYLRRHGITVSLTATRDFLRNIHPNRDPALSRGLYAQFVNAYRTS